jgi:hypothetical protein
MVRRKFVLKKTLTSITTMPAKPRKYVELEKHHWWKYHTDRAMRMDQHYSSDAKTQNALDYINDPYLKKINA